MAPKASETRSAPGEAPTKIKAACETCRTRKIKVNMKNKPLTRPKLTYQTCTGERPACTPCKKRGQECVYATEPDELRIRALKRRYAELSQTSSNNEALIRLLRETPRDEAQAIFERIRSDESILSILISAGSPEHAPETTLMLAVEGARVRDLAEGVSTEGTTPEETWQPSTAAGMAERPPVNKQSIQYLIDATQETPSSETVAPATEPREHASPLQNPAGEQRLYGTSSRPQAEARTSRPDYTRASTWTWQPPPDRTTLSHEKRTRLSEPIIHRPSLPATRHIWTARAPHRPKAKSEASALAARPHRTDDSWKRGLEDVKGADWDVFYTDDHTFLEVLNCYFTWENPALAFVEERPFWDGLVAGGSEFCNRALIHAILALGAVSL